jgi:hypothetical protein
MGMSGISKSQVSRLCEEIDVRVKAFLDRPIEGDWPYLWIDATYIKVRQNGRVVSVAVIAAAGANTGGVRCWAWRSDPPRRRPSGPTSCEGMTTAVEAVFAGKVRLYSRHAASN